MAAPLAYFKSLVDESGTTLNARKVDDTVLLDLALRECAADRKKAPWLTKLKTLLLGTHVWDVVPSFVTDAPDLHFVYQYDNKRTRAAVLFGLTPRVETIIFTNETDPGLVIKNPATIASILHDVPMLYSVTLPMPKVGDWASAVEADPELRAGCRGLSVIFSGATMTPAANRTAVTQVEKMFAKYGRRMPSRFVSTRETAAWMAAHAAAGYAGSFFFPWINDDRQRAEAFKAEREQANQLTFTVDEYLAGKDDDFDPTPTWQKGIGTVGATLLMYAVYRLAWNAPRPTDKISTLQINGLTTEERLGRLFSADSAAEVEAIRERVGRVPAEPAERPRPILTPRKAASPSASRKSFSPSPVRRPKSGSKPRRR